SRCPVKRGWSSGKPARPLNGSCQTGQARRSARAAAAAKPSGVSVPAPVTITGERAVASSSTSGSRCSGTPSAGGITVSGAIAGAAFVGSLPAPHRHRRSAGYGGLVVGAGDRAGHVLRAQRQMRPDRVLAGDALECAAGQERRQVQLLAVLLPDHY